MKKVSIIVPVYNTEKYLKRCLDSLVNQTLDDIEIIIIDDNSPDNSNEILKEYEKNYKDKIKVFHNKTNKGIGYNRNLGLKKAEGEYIAFVDSDDWVDITMYEKMYNNAKKENLDLVICNFHKMLDKNSELKELDIKDINYFKNTNLCKSPNLLLDVELAPWNKIYKKELVSNLSFPENLKYEDTIFVIKALVRSNKIGMVNEKLNYYLVRSKSETTVMNKKVFDILEITKMMMDELKKLDYYDKIKEYVEAMTIRNLFRYTLQQRNQKDKKVADKFINEAFNYLNNEFPNWRKNGIWKKRNILKRSIEGSKTLTKIYCRI